MSKPLSETLKQRPDCMEATAILFVVWARELVYVRKMTSEGGFEV